jgi:hypothetical protein
MSHTSIFSRIAAIPAGWARDMAEQALSTGCKPIPFRSIPEQYYDMYRRNQTRTCIEGGMVCLPFEEFVRISIATGKNVA